ncbi:hypothetical protein MNEG_7373 [Monoraphidium neglectum]|uniref:Uncharacterized protein n=1 Tax=Monoraphidium neglectum TaxID=145388 RepID=A0A0D2MBF2_9CHLO|nr:hypothetical protein MNEG_7373 [Monoraphidium neglectum]KIZ00590.1 hypothetical protein MNEG_7373 [Monoraphidium neglectum]|eukprot:XP_013899609.1 hypothetical protein MNEG_7373 [Monoraphidium neglectum]
MRLTVICVVILCLSCSANANLDIGAGLSQKAALVGGMFNAAQKQIGAKLHEGFNHVAITLGSGVSAAQAVQGAATNAAHMGLGFAQRKANQTAGVALGLAQLGVGAAQTAHSSVLGNLYDAADAFLKKPTVAAPANLTQDADGYCFPEFKGPDFGLPRPSCAQGYHMTPIGKCVQKTYRKIDVCFNGPKCMAPFNETGTPSCFDDKVMQVITGLLAMKKSGIALPLSIAPALAEFGQASANVPVTLAKESLELHLGLAAKALGVGKSALGLSDGGDLIGMGSKLMTVDWPALPDFNKLYDTVSKAVHQVPSKALDEATKVAPKCIRKCCKQDVQIDTAFAAPTWGCAAGKKMDTIGFKCVGDKLGYAKCPAGLTSCFLASWHRPLCAVKAENCKSLEIMAALHKLKKQSCPKA